MPTNFPNALDNLTNPTAATSQNELSHAALHTAIADAIEAMQARMGVVGSTDVNSLEYRVGRGGGGPNSAINVSIADAGGYFGTDNVEAALQQLGNALSTGSGGTAATTASAVTVADSGNYYDGTTVEAALQEAVKWVDPLTGAITTLGVHELLKLDGRVNVLRFIPKNLHANIKAGSDTTDLSTYIQAALDSGAREIYFPAGTYHAQNLVVSARTALIGDGYSSCVRANAGIGNTTSLLRATSVSSVSIRRMRFDGNNAGASTTVNRPRTSELLSFGLCTNLRLSGVIVHNVQYMGIAIGGCVDALLTNVEAYECGWNPAGPMGSSAEGGPAVWVGTSGSTQSQHVTLQNCYLHNNRWAGTYFSTSSGGIFNSWFHDNKEAHIFGSRAEPSILGGRVTIMGNRFENVTKAHISSSAIELGYYDFAVIGNLIEGCDHNGIALTDAANGDISGNVIYDFGKELAANGCGVAVIASAASPDQTQGIRIHHNRIVDRQVSVTGYAAFGVGGAGSAITNVIFENNDCSGWVQRNAATNGGLVAWAGKLGSGSVNRNNAGVGDTATHTSAFVSITHPVPTTSDSLVYFDNVSTDPDRLHGGAPAQDRFTIPAGWSKVRISVQVTFEPNATGLRQVRLLRNGLTGGLPGMPNVIMPSPAPAGFGTPLSFTTGIIPVSTGDYFQVRCRQESGGDLNLTTGAANTWFVIERIA